jgi:sigma-B regulation protein RsbU (phosphoserine phosphatase)
MGNAPHRHAEEALRDSEERFRRIAGMTTGEWIWEQGAVQEGRYIFSNGAVRASSGRVRTKSSGTTIPTSLPTTPDFTPSFSTECRDRTPSFRLTNRYRHKDGREIITESSGEPLFDHTGALIKWLGVDRDVIPRKVVRTCHRAGREVIGPKENQTRPRHLTMRFGMTSLISKGGLHDKAR